MIEKKSCTVLTDPVFISRNISPCSDLFQVSYWIELLLFFLKNIVITNVTEKKEIQRLPGNMCVLN